MSAYREKPRKRPSYPNSGRQWFGVFLTAFTIAFLEVLARNGAVLRSPGSILLLIVLFVTYWSGLRAGIISSALSLAYLSFAYAVPHTLFHYAGLNYNRIISATVMLPGLSLLVGSIQGRLRNAAIREYDAKENAEAEASQRRQTEGALRSSEHLRQLVVDSSMDSIVAIRENGAITLWNAAAETLFGWQADEVLGKLLSEVILPLSYREAHSVGMRRFLETGQAEIFGKRLELSALTKDGREFPIELCVVPLKSEDGYIFIGFMRDLTEQKRLSERLRQAQKMEAIGTLAGGIAHDFNNILAAISGNLVLARGDIPADNPIQESLSEIEKAVARATYVVRQILTFSSANEAHGVAIDVRQALEDAVKLLRSALPAGIEIKTEYGANLSPIQANTTDIHQIVLNLGINAHHAMGQNGVFEVRADEVDLDESEAKSLGAIGQGRYVQISVSDTGCGMDAETLQRIFEPFFTTKPTGEGTGLGLSVVYGLVERHHGAISAYSEPSKGTVFKVFFPIAKSQPEKENPPTVVAQSGHGETILYVDDDEALVYMMKRVLTRLNYEVIGFEDPLEGLAAFRAEPDRFNLVITDMSMPRVNGPELVRQLHAIRSDVPIVMITGYIRPSDLEQAEELGINKLMLKPDTVHELANAVHEILTDIREKEAIASS